MGGAGGTHKAGDCCPSQVGQGRAPRPPPLPLYPWVMPGQNCPGPLASLGGAHGHCGLALGGKTEALCKVQP